MASSRSSGSAVSVELKVNGEARRTPAATLSSFLEELGLQGRPIAVELNRQIVQKQDYSTTDLQDGDSLEIIQFVGGG